MDESNEIQAKVSEFAAWLKTVRVSQDGWAKVVERVATDAADVADALACGKIQGHIPTHLKNRT